MESAPGPGWFADPTGRHVYRWWDGARWQPQVWDASGGSVDPVSSSSRTMIASCLALTAAAALSVGALFSMGDHDSRSRSALTRQGNAMVVLTAVCPRERLRSLTVYGLDASGERSAVVWKVRGDAPSYDEVVVGVAPAGVSVVSQLVTSASGGQVEVDVVSSELPYGTVVRSSREPVAAGQIVGLFGTYPDAAAFRRDVLTKMPCGDPYGTRRQRTIGRVMAAVGVVLGAAAAAMVFSRRRRFPSPVAA